MESKWLALPQVRYGFPPLHPTRDRAGAGLAPLPEAGTSPRLLCVPWVLCRRTKWIAAIGGLAHIFNVFPYLKHGRPQTQISGIGKAASRTARSHLRLNYCHYATTRNELVHAWPRKEQEHAWMYCKFATAWPGTWTPWLMTLDEQPYKTFGERCFNAACPSSTASWRYVGLTYVPSIFKSTLESWTVVSKS
jgi:hypothetical protein